MSDVRFRPLLADLCRFVGVDASDILETGSLRIGDVDFMLSCGLGVFSECMQVNCDFGLSPDAQSGGGCAELLRFNVMAHEFSRLGEQIHMVFGASGSGRVLLMSALPLADLSGQKLATYLDTLAGQAIAWRQGEDCLTTAIRGAGNGRQ